MTAKSLLTQTLGPRGTAAVRTEVAFKLEEPAVSGMRRSSFSLARCFSLPSNAVNVAVLEASTVAKSASERHNARKHASSGNPVLDAVREKRLGFSFSGGGFLLPYFVGVVKALQSLGLMGPSTQVAGSSAGSLIAASITSGVHMDTVSYVRGIKSCYV